MQSAGHAVSRLDALLCVPAFQQVCQGLFNLWELFLFPLLYLNTISQKIQENFALKSHVPLFLFNYCILLTGIHLPIVFFPENPPDFPPYFMDKKHIHPGIMPRHAPIWAKTANILALRKACAPHILFRHKKAPAQFFLTQGRGCVKGEPLRVPPSRQIRAAALAF